MELEGWLRGGISDPPMIGIGSMARYRVAESNGFSNERIAIATSA
jgi:hypothetical protein